MGWDPRRRIDRRGPGYLANRLLASDRHDGPWTASVPRLKPPVEIDLIAPHQVLIWCIAE